MKTVAYSKNTMAYRNYKAWENKSGSKKAKALAGFVRNPAYSRWRTERPWGDDTAALEEWYKAEPEYYLPPRRLDFCTYFWGAVKGFFMRFADQIWALVFISIAVGFLVGMSAFGAFPNGPWWLRFVVGPVLLVIGAAAVVAVIFGMIHFFFEWLPNKRKEREPKPSIMVEKYRQVKRGSKICPFIEFKDS